jgi:hypothetical protein
MDIEAAVAQGIIGWTGAHDFKMSDEELLG